MNLLYRPIGLHGVYLDQTHNSMIDSILDHIGPDLVSTDGDIRVMLVEWTELLDVANIKEVLSSAKMSVDDILICLFKGEDYYSNLKSFLLDIIAYELREIEADTRLQTMIVQSTKQADKAVEWLKDYSGVLRESHEYLGTYNSIAEADPRSIDEKLATIICAWAADDLRDRYRVLQEERTADVSRRIEPDGDYSIGLLKILSLLLSTVSTLGAEGAYSEEGPFHRFLIVSACDPDTTSDFLNVCGILPEGGLQTCSPLGAESNLQDKECISFTFDCEVLGIDEKWVYLRREDKDDIKLIRISRKEYRQPFWFEPGESLKAGTKLGDGLAIIGGGDVKPFVPASIGRRECKLKVVSASAANIGCCFREQAPTRTCTILLRESGNAESEGLSNNLLLAMEDELEDAEFADILCLEYKTKKAGAKRGIRLGSKYLYDKKPECIGQMLLAIIKPFIEYSSTLRELGQDGAIHNNVWRDLKRMDSELVMKDE